METNPIRSGLNRKEIRCSDCGHIYFTAWGQKSTRCSQCGNIEFLSDNVQPLQDLARSPIEILKHRILDKAQEIKRPIPAPLENPLEIFQRAADGVIVDKIMASYQVEWQLWAMLVKNFSDPNYHAAYLTQVAMRKNYDLAVERYTAHRSAMSMLREEAWQAEVADTMLSRLESFSVLGMEKEVKGWRPWEFLYLMPMDGRVVRFSYFLIGFYLLFKLWGIR